MFFKNFLPGFFYLCIIPVFVCSYKNLDANQQAMFVGVPTCEAYSLLPDDNIVITKNNEPLLSSTSQGLNTQALLGDRVQIIEKNIKYRGTNWAYIKLLDQPTFKDGVWIPKMCFVPQSTCIAGPSSWQANAVVKSVTASMRAKPEKNALQLGQLSMGTRIKVVKNTSHDWVEVLLPSGVKGFIAASCVVIIDTLNTVTEGARRDHVLSAALQFESSPYRWCCCSGFDSTSKNLTGVDCSGLVYLSYRTIGLNVPRDAHDQFMASAPVKYGGDLKRGDLIFIANINQEKKVVRVNHVMMVAGHDKVIEATGLGASSLRELTEPSKACVRVISTHDHLSLKKSLKEFWHGQLNEQGKLIFFGTFLGDKRVYKRIKNGFFA